MSPWLCFGILTHDSGILCPGGLEKVWTMSSLACSEDLRKTIRDAIDVLQVESPSSPVIEWWNSEGIRLTFLITDNFPTQQDQQMACERLTYLKKALHDAMQNRDVDDLEYIITRLVSDIDDIKNFVNQTYYRADVVNETTNILVVESVDSHEFMLITQVIKYDNYDFVSEVYAFDGKSTGFSRGSAA